MRARLVLPALVAAILAAGACSRPVSSEQFVSADKREANGLYRFKLDLSDSLATYDVSFYSRIDAGRLKLENNRDLPMMVTWSAPSGRRYRETVYFVLSDESPGSDTFSGQFVKPYRTGLVPTEYGEWELNVLVNSGADYPGFRGLGVICKKNLSDGSR